MLKMAMKEAAELAVFGLLCVLDGVSAIENGSDKGDLKLFYKKGADEILQNEQAGEHLHDLYNGLCQQDWQKESV